MIRFLGSSYLVDYLPLKKLYCSIYLQTYGKTKHRFLVCFMVLPKYNVQQIIQPTGMPWRTINDCYFYENNSKLDMENFITETPLKRNNCIDYLRVRL